MLCGKVGIQSFDFLDQGIEDALVAWTPKCHSIKDQTQQKVLQ